MPSSNKSNNEMSPLEIGTMLVRLETLVSGIGNKMDEVISDFKDVHRDHENRIRFIENKKAGRDELDGVKKSLLAEMAEIRTKQDAIKTIIWRILLLLAAAGIGGGAIFKVVGM